MILRKIFKWLLILVGGCFLVLFIWLYPHLNWDAIGIDPPLRGYLVDGSSMTPTFSNGDTVMVLRWFQYKVGDVIVFECHVYQCVKEDGTFPDFTKRIHFIKDNCYWVEGDNKNNSLDSRSFGWLCPGEINVRGKIVF